MNQSDSCEHVYSKSMDQDYPRRCLLCGEMEVQEATDPMLQFFKWEHLPEKMQKVSRPFACLAESVVARLPSNPERTSALRKLLEAKDCAVRALIYTT